MSVPAGKQLKSRNRLPTTQSSFPATSPERISSPGAASQILDLQRSAGNQAVQSQILSQPQSRRGAGPRSSDELVFLNATIGGVYIESARPDVADALLRGYSRDIGTRLAAVEAFANTQRELREEFPVTSWLVAGFSSDLPESKFAPANLARADGCIKRAQYREAVDLLAAAENEIDVLVAGMKGYQESQEVATGHFITALQGAKIAGGIAVGVLTAGSGTAFVAAAGAGYAAVQEASEQAMKLHLGLIREIDWEGIIVDAIINLAIGKLTAGLTRFSRGPDLARQFGKVAPWQFRKIPELEIREFAVRTARALLTRQTVKEMLIMKFMSMVQTSLKAGYDAARNRDAGRGFVESLKERFSSMLFDEKGDLDFQKLFFQTLADGLSSATNRAAVFPTNPLPNEPPIGGRVKSLSTEERARAENLLRRSVGLAQEGPAQVTRFPSKKPGKTPKVVKQSKSGSPQVVEISGIADRGTQFPDRVTVRSVKGKGDGRVVSIEVPNYGDLPLTRRDNVLARAMKAAGMGWKNWSGDSSHVQALEHRGPEMPYNREPAPKAMNRGVKGQVTRRTLESAFTQFQKKTAPAMLGRALFSRKLDALNRLLSERITAFDKSGNVVFDMERKGQQLVDHLNP